MKVCFVAPPHTQAEKAEPIPLGLICLAAQLKSHHDVTIVDINTFRKVENSRELPQQILFWANQIFNTNPDIIGFSCLCNSFHIIVQLAKTCRNLAPSIPIIFGGPQCTGLEAEIIEAFDFVDAVVSGEADTIINDVIDVLIGVRQTPLPNNVYIRKCYDINKLEPTPVMLDDLPFPEYKMLQVQNYPQLSNLHNDLPISIDAGRGCPYSCTFCATRMIWGKVRQKCAERLIYEMETLADTYNKRYFRLIHDSFLTKRIITEQLLNEFISFGLDAKWICSIKPDLLDESLIDKFKTAGCCGMFFGIETGSEYIQKSIRKKMDIQKCLMNVEYAVKIGIDVTTSFIIGFPFECDQDIQQTLDLHKKSVDLGVRHSMVNMLSPLPASQLSHEYQDIFFDGFPPNLSDPVIQFNDESLALINNHPKIFSSFYKFTHTKLSFTEVAVAHFLANNYTTIIEDQRFSHDQVI